MLTHLHTIVSQSVLLDKISGLATYLNEVEGLTLPQLPGKAPPLVITTLWFTDNPKNETLEARHRVIAPSGQEVVRSDLAGDRFPEGSDRHRQINFTAGIPLPEAGMYAFVTERKVNGKWVEVARIPIRISAAPFVATAAAPAFAERLTKRR